MLISVKKIGSGADEVMLQTDKIIYIKYTDNAAYFYTLNDKFIKEFDTYDDRVSFANFIARHI